MVHLSKNGIRKKHSNAKLWPDVNGREDTGKHTGGDDHLERQGLIRYSQHDFVKGSSCLTNLTEYCSAT